LPPIAYVAAWKVVTGGKSVLTFPWVILVILSYSFPVYPHVGGLDHYGCHHNRKQGNYHCHKGMFEGKWIDSMQEMRIQPHSGKQLRELDKGGTVTLQSC